MLDSIINQVISPKIERVGIQHNLVLPFRSEKSIIGERIVRIEIKDEDEITPEVGQHLIFILIPQSDNWYLLKMFDG